ncbi:MAG: DUF3352 domain-containing protein [Trichocoleus desertorum ATA4-8-CV12]|jgi:hypothetical protein|nr:DUF3352 domain-containing protein [Trichocoleus desertorum ATA4-8-CV12]
MIEKKNKVALALALGAAGLLIAGGAATYWFITQRNTGSGDVPAGANIIPQTALMAVSVSTDPNQWQTLRQFGTPETQALVDQNLAQWRDRLLTANGYNYQKDIQPWVGKQATFAFLPPQSPPPASSTPNLPAPTPGGQQSVVLVLPITNPGQAQQALSQPKTGVATKWAQRDYKGFQIRETQGAPTQNYSATVLDGRFLVVTTDPKVTDQAIDTYKGGASLLTAPGYSAAFSKVGNNQAFANLYVNVPAAAAVASTSSAVPVAPESLTQQIQGLTATFNLQPQGVLVRSVSWLKPDSKKKYTVENAARSMTSRLPAETLVMASGGNLKHLWEQYIQGATTATSPNLTNPQVLREGLQTQTGLDLDKDLLKWMDGEFSLALISNPQKAPTDLPAGLMFMVQASDRRAAEKAFKQLDEVMTKRYNFKVNEVKVGNQSTITWSPALGGAIASHGWLDSNVAFLSVGAPVANGIIPKPLTPLAASELFQATVPTELKPNNGHFFIDVDRTLSSNLALIRLAPSSQVWAKAIQSIGVTGAINDERTTRYDVFVRLRQGNKPGPLPSASSNPGVTPSPTLPPSPTPSP